MTRLRWTGGTFTDGRRGFRTTGPAEHDFEDEDRVDEYLEHRSGNWERVEDDADEDASTDEGDSDGDADADAETDAGDGADGADQDDVDESIDELEAEGESGTLPFNPEDHTNSEIEDRVAEIDDVETLRALRNLEAEQEDRTGATDAIEDRIDELEG